MIQALFALAALLLIVDLALRVALFAMGRRLMARQPELRDELGFRELRLWYGGSPFHLIWRKQAGLPRRLRALIAASRIVSTAIVLCLVVLFGLLVSGRAGS